LKRYTEEDWRAKKTARISGQVTPSKYGNTRCTWQEEEFASERERDAYKAFKLQELSQTIRSVAREVSMRLPGTHRRIRIDFLVVENDGRCRWYDAKGIMTQAWALKRDLVKDGYGISIELI
jgi:uncharacterized protein YodC (DUF2158 family)